MRGALKLNLCNTSDVFLPQIINPSEHRRSQDFRLGGGGQTRNHIIEDQKEVRVFTVRIRICDGGAGGEI